MIRSKPKATRLGRALKVPLIELIALTFEKRSVAGTHVCVCVDSRLFSGYSGVLVLCSLSVDGIMREGLGRAKKLNSLSQYTGPGS